MILRMAWRNIWRNRRRTLITVATVAFGVWLAASFIGLATASYEQMIDGSTKLGLGHITIQPAGYSDSPSLEKRLSEAAPILERVRATEGVRGAVLRISGQAMFSTAARSVGGGFWGIDPGDENGDNNVFIKTIKRGELFKGTTGRHIVIGTVMAERLKVDLGKKVVYTAIDKDGEIVAEVARVSAIFETGVDDVDGAIALMPIDTVRKALGYGPDAATLLAVYAADQRETAGLVPRIAGLTEVGDAEVLPWQKTQPEIAGMIEMDRGSNYVFQLLLGMLIAAGVLNTMLMSVLERKRELGIMLAVGMSSSRLTAMVMLESLSVALVGLVIGIVLTTPWYWYLAEVGIDMASLYGDQSFDAAGVILETVLHVSLYAEQVVAILVGVFGLTLAAGVYPAWRAGREHPVDAIKEI